MIIKLPFVGFYCSWYSDQLDQEEERYVESVADEKELPAQDVGTALYYATSYGPAWNLLAKEYVDSFNEWFKDEYDVDLGLEFESLSSPREYNFQTDRIFATISVAMVERLYGMTDQGNLAREIRERFTSRSGFISFYSNDIEEWLAKPLPKWDHNELETLLLAVLYDQEDWEYKVFGSMAESEIFYRAFEASVDWEDFERRIEELKCKSPEET